MSRRTRLPNQDNSWIVEHHQHVIVIGIRGFMCAHRNADGTACPDRWATQPIGAITGTHHYLVSSIEMPEADRRLALVTGAACALRDAVSTGQTVPTMVATDPTVLAVCAAVDAYRTVRDMDEEGS